MPIVVLSYFNFRSKIVNRHSEIPVESDHLPAKTKNLTARSSRNFVIPTNVALRAIAKIKDLVLKHAQKRQGLY